MSLRKEVSQQQRGGNKGKMNSTQLKDKIVFYLDSTLIIIIERRRRGERYTISNRSQRRETITAVAWAIARYSTSAVLNERHQTGHSTIFNLSGWTSDNKLFLSFLGDKRVTKKNTKNGRGLAVKDISSPISIGISPNSERWSGRKQYALVDGR